MKTVSFLVAVAACSLLLALPGTAAATDTDIALKKTANGTAYAPGDLITYSLEATNNGPAAMGGAKVTDPLPAGLEWVSGDAGCYESSSGTVTCNFDELPLGTPVTKSFIARVRPDFFASQPSPPAHDHQLNVDKVERHLDLNAGETRTEAVSCDGAMPIATDGWVRVDHVDQGTGTVADVVVSEARSTDKGTYQFTVTNNASGRAQAKLFVVCMSDYTTDTNGHKHEILIAPGSGAPFSHSRTLDAPGSHEISVGCPSGTQPTAPGYRITGGAGKVYRSWRSTGSDGKPTWVFGVQTSSPGVVFEASVRCLRKQVAPAAGHTHDLHLQEIDRDVNVGPGTEVHRLSCGDYNADAKGITAMYHLDQALYLLGTSPEPINRDFTIYNPTVGSLGGKLGLLCLRTRTSTAKNEYRTAPVTNTATAVGFGPDTDHSNDSSSVTVTVDEGDPPDPAPPTISFRSAVSLGKATEGRAARGGRSLLARVTCEGAAGCHGVIKVAARVGKKRWATVARSRASLDRGQTRKLALGLTRKGKQKIKRWRKAKRVRVTTRFDLGGAPYADQQRVKLR